MKYTESRLSHFKNAVLKRYGIELSPEDIRGIYSQIEDNTAKKMRDVLAQKEEWEVKVNSPLRQSIKVIYDSKRKILITALPCTPFNHKAINAKRNRQSRQP